MENASLELESTAAPQESPDDPHKTLELIEALGRDLDALESSAPRQGFFKFVRRHLLRGAKN